MSTKLPQVRVLAYNGEDIGMGFNSDSGLAIGTALDFDEPVRQSGQEAKATAEIITTHEALMESLGVSAEAEGRYGFASAGLKVDFSKNTSYNSVSTFVVAKMVVNNQVVRGRNFRIKEDARRLLTADSDAFSTAYGDSFVRGQFRGGEFFAVLRITSLDTAVQTDLAVTLQAEINGAVGAASFTGKYDTYKSEAHSRVELHVVFYQKGGEGEEEIGTTTSVDDVKDRLKSLPSAVARHPFPYEIEVATYDTVPVPVPPKIWQDAFVVATADADRQRLSYLQKYNDFTFAAEHPEFFEDPPPATEIRAATQAYARAVDAVTRHAIRLSRGEIDPPQLFDPAAVDPPLQFPAVELRRRIGGVERSYADWYERRDQPGILSDDRKLVNQVAWAVHDRIDNLEGIVDPGGDPLKTEHMRGEALAQAVNGMEKFRIEWYPDNMGITSIAHLPAMIPKDRLTELVISGDHNEGALTSLQGIEQLEKLELLNVAGNRIGQVLDPARLAFLRELDVSNNEIRDVSAFGHYPSLEVLSIGGNRIADISPLAAATKLRTLQLSDVKITLWSDDKPVEHMMAKTEFGVWSVETHDNPLQVITGLDAVPGIANPFLNFDQFNVRFGVLKDGPDAQFRGRAERIGLSEKFAVHLARDGERLEDEWRLLSVSREPSGPLAAEAFQAVQTFPLGAKLITLISPAANFLIWTAALEGNAASTQASATFLKDSSFITCDVEP